MKIAIVYNRDSQAVINLFGLPNQEKYGLNTIRKIRDALKAGGHQVKTFEGDKNIIRKLEEFMPSVITGERPGLVFNLSYGIQGRGRYMHIPGILEMLGIPYVGSGPEIQAIALDKVVTKIILQKKGLPTPRFTVMEKSDSELTEELSYPLIIKPKSEAVSFGLRIVNNEEELRQGVGDIYEKFQAPTLVEEYIAGREINVGLLGNNPVEALPPVELVFNEGEKIYTYEDKTHTSGRDIDKVCPAILSEEKTKELQDLSIAAFNSLGCFDSARVDFRLDKDENPYILEINSMASLGPGGSYVFAADKVGLDYNALANRLVEVASKRYFGETMVMGDNNGGVQKKEQEIFSFLIKKRDKLERELRDWTNLPSSTDDPVGLSTVIKKIDERLRDLNFKQLQDLTNKRSAWTWESKGGLEGGTLLVVPVDVPREGGGYPISFRRDPEWLYGEGIGSSRSGLACMLYAFNALRSVRKLRASKIGVFLYSDEGRGMRYSSQFLRQAACRAKQVIVLQPGYLGGKVVDQRRGSRKFNIMVEGGSLRIGVKGTKIDALSWFLQKAEKLSSFGDTEKRLSVAIQDVHSERHSMLMPHRVRATVYITYLDSELADDTEKEIKKLFASSVKGIQSFFEKLEERQPLRRSSQSKKFLAKIKDISYQWKLPYGTEAGLLPSAAGEVPKDIPVICGFAPASRDIYTPNEAIHRGELLQRTLLLALLLLENGADFNGF